MGYAGLRGMGIGSSAAQLDAAAAAFDTVGNINQALPTRQGKLRSLPIVDQVICGPAVTAGTMVAANTTLSIDSVNYVTAPAAKVTAANWSGSDAVAITARTAMDPDKDLSAVTDIVVRFYLYPGVEGSTTDFRGISVIWLNLFDGSGKARGYKLYLYGPQATAVVLSTSGWYEATVNVSNFATENAGFDISTVNLYSFYVERRAVAPNALRDMVPVFTFDSIKFLTADKARIMWRFDDGYTVQYQECGILEQYRQRGTLCIIPDTIGASGVLTLAQLKKLHESGHYIANHNISSVHESQGSSGTNTYFSDTATMLAGFQTARNMLNSYGFCRGANTYILPGGKWNHDWNDSLAPYMDGIWFSAQLWGIGTTGVHSQANTKYISGYLCDGKSAADVKAYIDLAIANKGLAPLYWHSLAANVAVIEEVAAYVLTKIVSGDIECVTPDEYFALP